MVITIGATKGGAGKTWLALNLALYAARKGLSVSVCDLNPAQSLTADLAILQARGQSGGVTVVQQCRSNAAVHVNDTAQFLGLDGTQAAWQAADLLVCPVRPQVADQVAYAAGLHAYLADLRGTAPIAIIPIGVHPFRNQPTRARLREFLAKLAPIAASPPEEDWIDWNSTMEAQDTRSVFGTGVSQKFASKAVANFAWLFAFARAAAAGGKVQ